MSHDSLCGVTHSPCESCSGNEGLAKLLASWGEIGPNARKALVLIAERMAIGRKRYGEDFDRERDWTKEAQEEFLDGAIYLAIRAGK